MSKPTMIAASLMAFGILAAGARLVAQQGEGRSATAPKAEGAALPVPRSHGPLDPAIRKLVEARIAAASDVYRDEMSRLENTNMPPAEDLPVWSRRWMEAQIHLDSGPAGLLAAIQAHLERVRRLEEVADNYARTGQGRSVGPLRAKYFRLEAEQMLAEARAAHPEVPLPASNADTKPRVPVLNPPPPPPFSPR